MNRLSGKLVLLGLGAWILANACAGYKSPSWEAIPYDPVHTTLSEPERTQLADAMADYAGTLTAGGTVSANLDTLRAKAIALALRLDPENKSAVILNAKFKRGETVAAKGPSIPKESLTRILTMQVRRLQEPNGPGQDAALAAYMLDFLSAIDPANEELLYQSEMASRKTAVNWAAVLTASNRIVPPPASKTVDSSAGAADSPRQVESAAANPRRRSLQTQQSKVNGLVVMSADSNVIGGKVMEIIVTAATKSGVSTCSLLAAASPNMKISLDEAFRYVKLHAPESANGIAFTVSFDDKYTKMGGGSAGTAFTVGLLSVVDNLHLDPAVAITGDITVDGKVRKVGGVPIKIRGAALDGCRIVAVPVDNGVDVGNLMVLKGYRAIAGIQIFSITTVTEAIAIARQDRDSKLAEAIQTFAQIQESLDGSVALADASIVSKIDRVLALAPNHLSAQYLRDKISGKAPTQLTAPAAIEEVLQAASPLLTYFKSLTAQDRVRSGGGVLGFTLPKEVYTGIRTQLNDLDKKIPPQAEGIYYAVTNLLEQVEYFDERYQGMPHSTSITSYKRAFANDVPRSNRLEDILKLYETLRGELIKLDYDKTFIESQLH